ncbi:MAG: hypothetical protein QXG86_03905 [Candidatus Woesearchaeota archaeon]
MPEESKRISLVIFLISIFVFLAIIIFVFSFSLTRGGANYTATTTKTAMECIGYGFRIIGGSIDYKEDELTFIIEPAGGGKINKLIVKSENQEKETKNIDFSSSFKQQVKINIRANEYFEIYPVGCPENIKRCSISRNICESGQ